MEEDRRTGKRTTEISPNPVNTKKPRIGATSAAPHNNVVKKVAVATVTTDGGTKARKKTSMSTKRDNSATNAASSLGQLKKEDEQNMDVQEAVVEDIKTSAAQKKEPPEQGIHYKMKEALTQCDDQLQKTLDLVKDPQNTRFCPPSLREELCNEISQAIKQSPPNAIIGCLGGTGVGKSSLLNALLNEADILPTSGSRGCTAAVVELRFNREFYQCEQHELPSTPPKEKVDQQATKTMITVYRGSIEFISMENWKSELGLLLEDCCQEETGLISSQIREDNEEAASAWAKIDSVYGSGTMKSNEGKDTATVLDSLSKDKRVVDLLQSENDQPNTILIEEGKVDGTKAKLLLEHLTDPKKTRNKKLIREKKAWAKKFRAKINDYVYRKGDGKDPQTWPLIRKVVLRGPWAVLSTGACLVDMPGVRDANAARAKVAERYLQNCHKMWIVAPIQRAVDDKTAKDLMGEEFRRRLLMDGQYGNVGFICTRSDDCEISETMRDHEEVARSREGRWEQMLEWKARIAELEKERDDLQQQRDDLEADLDELKEERKEIAAELSEMSGNDDDEGEGDNTTCDDDNLIGLRNSLAAKKKALGVVKAKIHAWEKANNDTLQCYDSEMRQTQQQLKAAAAMVRNEYSVTSLQADFQKGLEEVARIPHSEERGDPPNATIPLPDNFQLEVFCTASNDYLKMQKIKGSTDGQASCFARPEETQIPKVVASVHDTTAEFRKAYTEKQINAIGNILERIHLCATEDREDCQAGKKYRQVFETIIKDLGQGTDAIADEFSKNMEALVKSELEPSLKRAAVKGNSNAMDIVLSWASASRRNKHERGPKRNGLHYCTYNAAVKRLGVYKSSVAGQINLNQELCDPLEKEFSAEWQRTMDAGAKQLLANAMVQVLDFCTKLSQSFDKACQMAGMDAERSVALATAAKRSCDIVVKGAFRAMDQNLMEAQRKLNRSLLNRMAKRMTPSYTAASSVPGGTGKFVRQTAALKKKAEKALVNKFEPMMTHLLEKVNKVKNDAVLAIRELPKVIEQRLYGVYSVCWNDQKYVDSLKDAKVRLEVRSCRNRLLPSIIGLLESNKATMDLMGMEHEEVEYNVVGIETQEDRLAKSMLEAQEKGLFFDLADDDSDEEEEGDENAKAAPCPVAVKPEPGTANQSKAATSIMKQRVIGESNNLKDVSRVAPNRTVGAGGSLARGPTPTSRQQQFSTGPPVARGHHAGSQPRNWQPQPTQYNRNSASAAMNNHRTYHPVGHPGAPLTHPGFRMLRSTQHAAYLAAPNVLQQQRQQHHHHQQQQHALSFPSLPPQVWSSQAARSRGHHSYPAHHQTGQL